MKVKCNCIYCQSGEPIHQWFELSYAQYLTIPRSVLQSMPEEWQKRFVHLLEELDDTVDWRPQRGQCYFVDLWRLEDNMDGSQEKSIKVDDPLADYKRGRRRIPLKN